MLVAAGSMCGVGLSGCMGLLDDAEEIQGELNVSLFNGTDAGIELGFTLLDPDGTTIANEEPTVDPDDEWEYVATGLRTGLYYYTMTAPMYTITEPWNLNEFCSLLRIDASVTDPEMITVESTCETLET